MLGKRFLRWERLHPPVPPKGAGGGGVGDGAAPIPTPIMLMVVETVEDVPKDGNLEKARSVI